MIALVIVLDVVLKMSSSQLFSSEDDGLVIALEVGTNGSLPLNLHMLAGFQFCEDIEGDGSPARLVYGGGVLEDKQMVYVPILLNSYIKTGKK